MMKKILALALVLTMPVPAFAEGPLARAARDAAAKTQIEPQGQRGGSKGMTWGGIAMIAAGSTLATLGTTALKTETCGAAVIGFSVIGGCVEETNKGLLWTGVGIAAGGATLLAVGANRNIQFGPNHVSYRAKF